MAEEMLDAPPIWNEVLDLMIETKDGRMITEEPTKRKRDEVACLFTQNQVIKRF